MEILQTINTIYNKINVKRREDVAKLTTDEDDLKRKRAKEGLVAPSKDFKMMTP